MCTLGVLVSLVIRNIHMHIYTHMHAHGHTHVNTSMHTQACTLKLPILLEPWLRPKTNRVKNLAAEKAAGFLRRKAGNLRSGRYREGQIGGRFKIKSS